MLLKEARGIRQVALMMMPILQPYFLAGECGEARVNNLDAGVWLKRVHRSVVFDGTSCNVSLRYPQLSDVSKEYIRKSP